MFDFGITECETLTRKCLVSINGDVIEINASNATVTFASGDELVFAVRDSEVWQFDFVNKPRTRRAARR